MGFEHMWDGFANVWYASQIDTMGQDDSIELANYLYLIDSPFISTPWMR